MWRIYTCLRYEHDNRLVAIAVGICVLGSLISAMFLQRGVISTRERRFYWIVLSGIVTGIVIWTTHFAAMLGYAPGPKFDAATAIISGFVCILFGVVGWIVGFGGTRRRGVTGGGLVGFGLATGHFLDMAALRFSGTVSYDSDLILASVVAGLSLSALSGWLMQKSHASAMALPAALALASAILSLHFIAMAGMTILPSVGPATNYGELDVHAIAAAVMATSVAIVTIALGLTFHSQRLARATEREHEAMLGALSALRKSEDHHRASVELNPQIPWVADPSGLITEIAPRWGELVGLPSEQALGTGWSRVVHTADLPGVMAVWKRAIETGQRDAADTRYRIRLHDDSYRWFRAVARPRYNDKGEVIAWYGNLEDIHDQVKSELALRESEERYRLASRATNDVIWDWSAETNLITWAGAYLEVLGFPELSERTTLDWWEERIHPDDRERIVSSQLSLEFGDNSQWDHEYRMRVAGGDYIHVYSRGQIVRNIQGRAIRAVGSIKDITARKRIERDLRWTANHDPLTKLPNRSLYSDGLDTAIERARKYGGCVGLIVVDLNKFKVLNDSMGHAVGDAVLVEVAARLSRTIPQGAMAARLGGDEFAIILPNIPLTDAKAEMVQAILSPIDAPFLVDDIRINVMLSAGFAIWPRDAETADDLLKCADLALYVAKADTPGTIRGFRPEMRQASETTRRMLADARTALNRNRIVPFYQPKICLRTGRILGFEALLRWYDKHANIKPPSDIAAAFSDSILAVQLTERMLDRIIADCTKWKQAGIPILRIAFNVTGADFGRGDLADRILNKIAAAQLEPSCFEIEVTESVFIGHFSSRVERALRRLRDEGLTVALDDFGTGYASLTHLQRFAIDVIKIDRSFIMRLTEDTAGTAIVNGVLQMAQSMRIKTVAEGVETPEQAEYLCKRGCDVGQGYLFSRAIDASTIPLLLSDEKLQLSEWYDETIDKEAGGGSAT